MQTAVEAKLRQVQPGQAVLPVSSSHFIGIHWGAPVQATCVCHGQTHQRLQTQGDTDIIPAGLGGHWTDEGPCSVLLVRLSDALLEKTAQDQGLDWGNLELAPRFQVRDRQLEHLAWALQIEQEGPGSGQLYQDCLGTALAIQLLRHYTTEVRPAPAGRGLSVLQWRCLEEYIATHLDQDLSLSELSAVVGISGSHLKTLFRHSMGMPLHQYVLRQRVARAEYLIVHKRLPISQVALDVGFSQPSHLASWMRRLLGVTPKQLRMSESALLRPNLSDGESSAG